MIECPGLDETCGDCILTCDVTRDAYKRGLERGRRKTIEEVMEIANMCNDSGYTCSSVLARLQEMIKS